MRFSRNAPILILVTACVMLIALLCLSSRSINNVISSTEKDQLKYMDAIVSFNMQGAAKKATARAEIITNFPEIGKLLKEKNRDRVKEIFKPIFDKQKEKYGVDQMQFAVPPATSFLRLHDVTKFDDDLSKARPMILSALEKKKIEEGVTISRFGPAIVAIVPIYYKEVKTEIKTSDNKNMDDKKSGDDKTPKDKTPKDKTPKDKTPKDKEVKGYQESDELVGVVEVGISFEGMLNDLKRAYEFDLTFMVNEDALKKTAGDNLGSEVFNPDNMVAKYVNYHSTNWKLMKLFIGTDLVLDNQQTVIYTVKFLDGKPYGLVSIPVRHWNGAYLGSIVTCQSLANTRSLGKTLNVTQIFVTIFAFVVIIGVVIVCIKGLVTKPILDIGKQLENFAQGDFSQELDTKRFCNELQTMAQSMEKLKEKFSDTTKGQ